MSEENNNQPEISPNKPESGERSTGGFRRLLRRIRQGGEPETTATDIFAGIQRDTVLPTGKPLDTVITEPDSTPSEIPTIDNSVKAPAPEVGYKPSKIFNFAPAENSTGKPIKVETVSTPNVLGETPEDAEARLAREKAKNKPMNIPTNARPDVGQIFRPTDTPKTK